MSGKKALDVDQLRRGDRWNLLAHNRNPDEIKAD